MVNEPSRYLTVREAAERLRVAAQTVYRWCRSGQLPATRFGRQWRILLPEAPVERDGRAVRASCGQLLDFLSGREEHLLLLTSDEEALERFMLECLEKALASDLADPACVQWGESEEDLAVRLRDFLPSGGQKRRVQLLPFGERYALDGNEGIAKCLREAGQRAAPRPGWVAGAPQRFFGVHYDRLIAMEATTDATLKGAGWLAICGYVLAPHQPGFLRALSTLIGYHSGLVWYDGERAVLLRPQAIRRGSRRRQAST